MKPRELLSITVAVDVLFFHSTLFYFGSYVVKVYLCTKKDTKEVLALKQMSKAHIKHTDKVLRNP